MSTRAIIGAAQSSGGSVGVRGVYHHSDGYPTGLGAYLFRLIRYEYDGNVRAAYEAIVSAHPAGWSHLYPAPEDYRDPRSPKRPKCYCHPARGQAESAQVCSTFAGEDDGGTEWAYGLNPIGHTMSVMAQQYDGMGNTNWHQVALVDLDGVEPDWVKIEDGKDYEGEDVSWSWWVDEFFGRVTMPLGDSEGEPVEFVYNGCVFMCGVA